MTKFKDALSDLVATSLSSKARRSFAPRTAVQRAMVHLDQVVAKTLELDEPIDQFQARVLKAFVDHRFNVLPLRDIRRVPWALWGGALPLSDHPALLEAYAVVLRSAQRPLWYSILRQAYFQSYEPRLAQAERVLELLREGQAISKWRWAEQSAEFKLFDQLGISASLTQAFSNAVPALETLEAAGFQLGLEVSSYVGHVFRQTCSRFDCRETVNEDWLWDFCQDTDELRYPEHADALVDGFLSPWEKTDPPADRRRKLIKRLIALFGDPRLNRARWEGISDRRVQQFTGWLTRDSIEMFLDIVGDNALDHQWKYRRAFWMSYLNAGVITDAWVLFGPRAYEDARRASKETKSTVRFARLDRPSSRDHSVLLLKLGDLTIAEFSHNGRVWIWPPKDARKAPGMYRSTYSVPDVTGAEIHFVHAGSETFRWQTNVADAIRRYTNIKPFTADWKPK